jgi:hypothetical protein
MLVSPVNANEKTSTGFYWPIGSSDFQMSNGWWLSKDPSYFKGMYHIGTDMMAPVGSKVVAVADGMISVVSYKENHVSGWTDCKTYDASNQCIAEYEDANRKNVGILITHTLNDKRTFYAVYGHLLKATAKMSGKVKAGDVIGYVGPWEHGSHVHFGIIPPGINYPQSSWGKMRISQWPSTNGFVDPVQFLKANSPHNNTIASQPDFRKAVGTKGLVLWEGTGKCMDATRVWLYDSPEALYAKGGNKSQLCGTIQELFYQQGSETAPVRASDLEQSKQSMFKTASDWLKSQLIDIRNFFTFAQIAKASGMTYDEYERYSTVVQKGVVYADGLAELPGRERHPTVYGFDSQLEEGVPVFSSHPVSLTASSLKKSTKYPNMVVNDLWMRKLTSGDGSHDHDFTFANLQNAEWRMQAKNTGKGMKDKNKTVVTQAYLWRIKDDGNSTQVEGVGKSDINKEMKSGSTTTEHVSLHDLASAIKWPGKYFLTGCLLTADLLKEENKSDNCWKQYDFNVINQSNLIALSVTSNDGKSVYRVTDIASFHASMRFDGDNFPKQTHIRGSWKLFGPSYPDGLILETDRVKSVTLAEKRGQTHGENIDGVSMNLLPGAYLMEFTINPQCTVTETNCNDNAQSFLFTIEEPAPSGIGEGVNPAAAIGSEAGTRTGVSTQAGTVSTLPNPTGDYGESGRSANELPIIQPDSTVGKASVLTDEQRRRNLSVAIDIILND